MKRGVKDILKKRFSCSPISLEFNEEREKIYFLEGIFIFTHLKHGNRDSYTKYFNIQDDELYGSSLNVCILVQQLILALNIP